MKYSKSKTFLQLALLVYLTVPAFAGEVKLHVEMTGGSFDAKSHDVRGVVKQVGNQLTAKEIVVPLAALNSGNSLRDNHMKNKYLEAGKYPNAVLSDVKAQDGKFTGKLTVHGVTKPVNGEYEVKDKNVSATFKTQLTNHSVPAVSYMGIGVEDEVEITATVPVETVNTHLPVSKK